MNGALISWAFIAFQKPHPKYFGWWIIILVLLPFGQLIGMPLLGLANGILTGLFFVVMGFFMLRFEPLPKGGER
jgi:predicted secreted protein